jgi:hypothetical protein
MYQAVIRQRERSFSLLIPLIFMVLAGKKVATYSVAGFRFFVT